MIKMKQNISFQMKYMLGWLICSSPNIFPMIDVLKKGPSSRTQIPQPMHSACTPERRHQCWKGGASAERKQAGIILALTAEPAPLPDFVGERLGAEPEESDVIHDLFAYLAERPSMNKEKNAEIKAFLDFPEGRISAPIEGLTNKTAIRYYWSPFQMNNNLLLQCLQRFL